MYQDGVLLNTVWIIYNTEHNSGEKCKNLIKTIKTISSIKKYIFGSATNTIIG